MVTNPIFGKFPYDSFPFNKQPLINVGPYDVYLYNLTNSFQIALYISNFILFYILYKFQNDLIKNIVSFKYINFLPIPFIIYLTFGGITNIYDIIPEIITITIFPFKFYPYRYNDFNIWKDIFTLNFNTRLFLSDFLILFSILLLSVSFFILKKGRKIILWAISLVLLAISRYFAYNPITGTSLSSNYFYPLSFPFILSSQYQILVFVIYFVYLISLMTYTKYKILASYLSVFNTLFFGAILIFGYFNYAGLASLNLYHFKALLTIYIEEGISGDPWQYLFIKTLSFAYIYYSMLFTVGILIFSAALLCLIDNIKNKFIRFSLV